MLNERWTQALPDELPILDQEDNPEIATLHSRLRMKITTNQARRKEAYEKHGVILDTRNELHARLELITNMFIGILSPERLHLEIQWQEALAAAVEEGIADAQEAKRQQQGSKTLHIPGRGTHTVPPAEENGNGT